ncbi:hypothetical protein ACOKFD_15325 [Flagellimonas sp. S174]|uniref:hypothetical protein n=1 Tax=Flagellimonas sp. S174 TaxID=3410790 RepID=UPI0026047BD3|nr:hypothetical protein [uncultured Allomuricauda sp.]
MDTHYKIAFWMVFMLFSAYLGTAQERVSKTVERSFELSNAGELQIENKYGNIDVTGWEQDKVAIKVSIRVNHRKKDNAQSLLSRINPEFKSGSNYVGVVSKIRKKNTGWFADFFNKTNPVDFDRSHVQIDYEVFMPSKAELRVTNRFGDVIIEGWSGPLNALVEHGDLWVTENLNKADVILKFGKVRTQDLEYASLYLKNGELEMENSNSLRLNSSGTDMDITSVKTLEIYSNKDDIAIAEIGSVYGTLKFSTLNIQRLMKEVNLDTKIADFRITQFIEPQSEISFEQESSEITLNVSGFSHRFRATLEQGVVRLPKSFENVNSKVLDKGRRLREIEATYGEDNAGLISINGIKGIVTIND